MTQGERRYETSSWESREDSTILALIYLFDFAIIALPPEDLPPYPHRWCQRVSKLHTHRSRFQGSVAAPAAQWLRACWAEVWETARAPIYGRHKNQGAFDTEHCRCHRGYMESWRGKSRVRVHPQL